MRCQCSGVNHHPKLVCVTGGPGAGKTALLEVIRRSFCEHVGVLPEAATILFTGGFPRAQDDIVCARAGQRAIYRVQVELERMVLEQRRAAVVLCDRGTLDGLAYWPGTPEAFFEDLGTTRARELARYAAVIHLRTPAATKGYNQRNPVRIETAAQAATLDRCIADAWAGHPARQFIESDVDFLQKLTHAIDLVKSLVPACCQGHPVVLGELRSPQPA
jgi:predicted ATPase